MKKKVLVEKITNCAIYPGSFDPITYGHISIVKRALKIFDTITIAVAINTSKEYRLL